MFRNKNFALLVSGQSLANMGDILYITSIISMIYQWTGSNFYTAFVPFTITSTMFLSSLLSPLAMNRWNLKWLLTFSQVGKTIIIILLTLLVTEMVAVPFIIVFLLIAGIGLLDGCANPISQTLIPYYVNSEQLVKANGFFDTITQIIQAGMWFISSLLLIRIGSNNLLWVVIGLFFLSSCLLSFLNSVQSSNTKQPSPFAEMKEGWHILYRTPILRKMAYIEGLDSIATTVWIAAILYVFVSERLQADHQWWGWINGAFFLGLILGSLYCMKYAKLVENKIRKVFMLGAIGAFFSTFLFAFNTLPVLALILAFSFGASMQIKGIPQHTMIQTSVSLTQLSKVYAALGALGTGIFALSSLLMGWLAETFNVQLVFLLSAALMAVISIVIKVNQQVFVKGNVKQT
ncbi:MFS transporter [Cytobacillus kochii]|uniref:MFS transporter n=1 Tax=Cytobacillus kochii TaxID=859143 RepID=UPI00278A6543|nr:MFS transporter [Cytobacillus kochii]MDQ0185323.1 MFS family permease [Cytobacillus kochii]